MIASLKETFPGIDWEKQGAYFFQRVIEHGRRRSEEVREVAAPCAKPASSPGAQPAPPSARPGWPTSPTRAVRRQGTAAFARSADWRIEADRILAQLKKEP